MAALPRLLSDAIGFFGKGAKQPMLSDYLPYRSYDAKSRLYYNQGSIGFLFETTPLIGGDDRAVNILSQLLSEGFPKETVMSVINWMSPRIAAKINDWYVPRYVAGGCYLEMARNRRDYLERGAWQTLGGDTPFILRHFRSFVACEIPIKASGDVRQLLGLRDGMIAAFGTLGMVCRDMEPSGLIALIREIMAPSQSQELDEVHYNPFEPIGDQCIPRNAVYKPERNRIAIRTEKFGPQPGSPRASRENHVSPEYFDCRTFGVSGMPKVWAMWDCAKLIGDQFADQLNVPCPILTTLSMRVGDREKASTLANVKAMRKRSQVESISARFVPNIPEQAEEWRSVSEMLQKGVNLVDAHYAVTMFAPWGDGDIDERTIRSLYKANGWDLYNIPYMQTQGLLACLPMTLGSGIMDDLVRTKRTKKMVSTTLANIVPLQGEYLGGNIAHLMLFGRRGEPFFWSPTENSAGNHNVCVFGKSGSGKSVLLQELCAGMVGAGDYVIVIDDGRSFQNSGRLQGARQIEFTMSSGFSLNVFRMIDAEQMASDGDYRLECMSLLKALVGQMARFTGRLDDEERGLIDRSVNEVWDEHGAEALIDDIIAKLQSLGGVKAASMATAMQGFSSKGTFGPLFVGNPSFSLADRFTIFELSDLSGHEELRAVVLTAIMFMSSQMMRKLDRSLAKSLIIDEAWQMLKGGAMADFVETYARTCRKYGSSLITATQSINDYYKSDGSLAALENSDWFVILEQKPETIAQFAKAERFEMNAHIEEQMRSLKRKGNLYSDVMIRGPETLGLGRLVIDPFSAVIFSSSPATYGRIEDLRAEGHDLVDIIYHVSEGRPLPRGMELPDAQASEHDHAEAAA